MDYSNSKDKFNEVATDPFIPSLVSLEQTPLSDSADASGQIPYMAEGIRLTGDVSDQEVEEEDERDVVGDCNDNSSSGILSQVDPEMIRMATQEAVDAAVAMKRSDSILSMESNETSSNRSGSLIFDDPLNISTRCSNASAKYMEAASFEATMLSSGIHRVLPHGKVQRGEQDSLSDIVRLSRLSTQESEEIESANGDDSLSTSIRRSSERCAFKNASKFSSDSVPLLETIVSTDRKEWLGEEATDISLLEILKSCDLATPKILLSKVHPLEVCLLHLVFENFCSPPLSVDSVQAIFKKQKNQSGLSVSLPVDIIIEKPSQTLVKLLGTPLLRLPEEWAMCFLRILLRLLTNESDAEYEEAILNSCPWYDETFRATDLGRPRLRTASTASLNNQSSFSDQSIHRTGNEAKKSNQMYSIVRLRGSWNSAVKQVLEVLDVVLNDAKYTYLAGPMTRLLGLLCTSGVSVMELQKILALATDTKASPYTQLLLVRTLQTAAAGASRPLMGKADPKTFFSFTFGTGISRTINLDKTSWPFRNDFGMALWFRVEYFHGSSTLLRVTNECGNGTEVSLLPLSTNGTGSGSATVSVIVVSVLEGGKPVESVKVNTCIVHERVWYHIAVRHTRSRLKGMFSLNSREQLSIILDGKHMATESLKFPLIKDSSSKSLTLTFGDNFDGQAGALYVFHSNVSDATLKALHDITSEITNLQSRRTTVEWDTRQGEIVRKSKVLDLGMRRDDIEDVVLSYRVDGKQNHHFTTVVDLEEEDESLENGPLSKNSFNQRLYLVWDPRRTVGATVLELHSGAHARLDPENVQQWTLEGVQDVISSLGGVQSVLPILWCLFSGNVENGWLSQPNDDNAMLQRCLMCSAVPDALLLLSSLVKSHNENAREMLRCGAIDLLEQALQSNKHLGLDRGYCTPAPSLVGSACMFPTLSARLVSAILEFRSTCSHYIGLETKVFSRLVFNPPLWLDGPCQGIAMFSDYLPSLSIISRRFPEKIRACVGVKGLVKVIIDLIEVNVSIARDHE